MSEFQFDVFLAYSSRDRIAVGTLARRLRSEGLRVWFDHWKIKPGDDIDSAVKLGIEASRAMVLCLSPAALGSGWVALERSTVPFRNPTDLGRRFVPLLIADCDLPEVLQQYQVVDFRRRSKSAVLELVAACTSGADIARVAREADGQVRSGPRPGKRRHESAAGMNVFVSHGSDDLDIATKLVKDLKSTGARCWFDQEKIRPGANWRRDTEEAIRRSSYFVALLSARSLAKKGFVHKELRLALDIVEELPHDAVFVIPVRIDDCNVSHASLRAAQWVDLFPSYEKGLRQLIQLFSRSVAEAIPGGSQNKLADVRRSPRESDGQALNFGANRLERREFEGPRIEGLWLSEITFPRGETNWHRMQLFREGSDIFGKTTCYKGYSKGRSYEVAGTFENLILTCTYRTVDPRRFEKGSMALMLVNDGMALRGHVAYYDDVTNTVESTNCEWLRKK